MTGVPLGRNLLSGATLCCDPISWFQRANLISNPSAFVLGKPGLGKSTVVRRMALGLAGCNRQDTDCLARLGRKLLDRTQEATQEIRDRLDLGQPETQQVRLLRPLAPTGQHVLQRAFDLTQRRVGVGYLSHQLVVTGVPVERRALPAGL